jgi:pimeloyl-ACP methyl ester carboxylesterase
MNRHALATASACFLALAAVLTSAAHAAAPAACAELTQFKVPGFAMEITQAATVPAGKAPAPPNAPPSDAMLPAYCRADGVIDKRTGSDGKPYAIGFAIALPENWNGRFMFQGGGGLNGAVRPPVGTRNTDTPALAEGFAVVSTDSGHQSAAVFDDSFFKEQQATLNFLYQAIGKVTVVAKAIIAHHYGNAAKHSYYVGCSTGGREAMVMSQRYPDYFDGIVAGAPAMRTSYSNLGDRWVATALNSIAPKDENGRPIGARALTEGERNLVVSSFVKACDAKDGVEDGMVFNPLACDFDPRALTCKGAKTDACLTTQQANALVKGFSGPKDSKGNQVYPGFFYDTGIAAAGRGAIPGLLMAGASPVGPPNFDTEMNVDAAAAAAASSVDTFGSSYAWTQLDTFSSRGGKLIFYHGISDPWFSAKDSVQYYERLGAANGGAAAVYEWSRLFLVPGMGHCQGGEAALDRFDMVKAIVDWVEKDVAPESVVATGRAFPGRSRPLCPHPKHAHYMGSGDREKADSFECRP